MLGKKLHRTTGMTVTVVVGASAYILGLVILVSPATEFTFDVPTQLLMMASRALVAIFAGSLAKTMNYQSDEKPKKKTI